MLVSFVKILNKKLRANFFGSPIMKRLFGYLNTFGCKLIIPKLIIFKFFFKTIFVLSTHPQIESDFILTPQTSTTSFKVLQIIPWVQLVRK